MAILLASYRPLIQTSAGRHAVKTSVLEPFLDGSCRREPDFNSPFPSITGLCRAAKLAPRLACGDEVIYITAKSTFGTSTPSHRYFVAHLEVVRRFQSHADAADWYTEQKFAIPTNCMTHDSKPLPYAETGGRWSRRKPRLSEQVRLKLWDDGYRDRARTHPVFLACKTRCLELQAPVRIEDVDLLKIFGRVPGTQNPPEITRSKANALLALASQPNAPRYAG